MRWHRGDEKRTKPPRRLPAVLVVCAVGFLLLWASAAPAWLLILSLVVFGSLCWITSTQDALRP